MKKDTFYFSHDANAKDDPKCMELIDELGLEGYGIFWVLIETLRNQPDYKCPLSIVKSLARRYNTSDEKIKAVILRYNLFVIENETFFFSDSLMRRMQLSDAKRLKLSEAGKNGNLKRWAKSILPSLPDSQAIATQSQLKEIKGNKIKENKNIVDKPESVSLDIWNDFLEIRNKKKAPVTKTVIEMIAKESLKANISLEDAIKYTIFRGWQSFKAEWYLKDNPGKQGTGVKSNAKEIV